MRKRKHKTYRAAELNAKSSEFLAELLDDVIWNPNWRPIPMQDTQSKTVYVCGKMRGVPQYNFPAFYQAAAMLRLWGHTPVNPAEMDVADGHAHYNHNSGDVILENSFTMERALRRDFEAILDRCDAVVMLPGWTASEGAQKEVAFAISVGIPVFLFDASAPLDLGSATPLEISVNVVCREVGA